MKRKVLPLILTIVVFVLDQLTKQLVMLNIPAYTIGASFFGDFLRIIHVYNPGIAFSMGNSLPDAARGMLFAVAPLVVLVVVLVIYFRNDEFTFFQRWAIAGLPSRGCGGFHRCEILWLVRTGTVAHLQRGGCRRVDMRFPADHQLCPCYGKGEPWTEGRRFWWECACPGIVLWWQ